MDNEIYFEESNPKSVKIILFIVLMCLFVVGIFYIYISRKYTLSIKGDLVFELGSEVSYDPSTYLENNINDPKDYKLVFTRVSISDDKFDKVGKYDFKVQYNNVSKKGRLVVVDTTKPEVETQDLTIGVDEEFNLDDFISVCNDYSKPCKVSLKDENDLKKTSKVGTYNFNITVSDKENNKVDKKVKLTVKKGYSRKELLINDLKPHHIEPEYSDWNKEMIIKYNKGIDPNEIEETEYYNELMEVTMNDLHTYLDPLYENNFIKESQIITVYNSYGYIIGYSIRVDLDNGLHFYLKK